MILILEKHRHTALLTYCTFNRQEIVTGSKFKMAANTGVKQEHSSEKAEGLPSTLQQPLTLSSAPSLGSEKCYTVGQKKITKTKEELTLPSTSHKPQLTITMKKQLDAEVYFKPKTIREGQSDSLEVRMAVQIKGKLHHNTVVIKSQSCYVVVATTVLEHGSGLILARYTNKQPFSLPKDGYANYEWRLISHAELEKCSSDKVDICIELLLQCQRLEQLRIETD